MGEGDACAHAFSKIGAPCVLQGCVDDCVAADTAQSERVHRPRRARQNARAMLGEEQHRTAFCKYKSRIHACTHARERVQPLPY
eukprot:3714012-Pleurochrysis_carterae.AAC.1